MSKVLLLQNRYDFLALFLCSIAMVVVFYSQLFSYLGHDEIPPYYSVAYDFYTAGPLQFLNILMHPSATFGHPFLFPMILGLLMKLFGVGSFIGKVYIFIFSSFTLFGLYKLSHFFLKDIINAILCVVLILFTSNYFINLPLLIGDTALLTLLVFYTYHLFKRHTKIVIYLAFIIGLTRESFLIYIFALLGAEVIFQLIEKKRDKPFLKAILWSPLSVILWYLYNLISEKSLIHSYASFNTEDSSHFNFSFAYAIPNAIEKFKNIFIQDPIIGFSFFVTVISLFFYKRFQAQHKRLILYSLSINLGTFLLLSFYHIFLNRYLLYSAYLLVINWVIVLSIFVQHRYGQRMLILFPFLFYLIYFPHFSEPYYGKNVNDSYNLTIKALDKIHELGEMQKPIVPCFPSNFYTLNRMGIYPRHPYNFAHYDKFNIKKIEEPYLYFICMPPIENDVNYKQFFKNKERELIQEFNANEQYLELWRIYL